MNIETSNWTDSELKKLKNLSHILIPGGAGMPSAQDTEIESIIDRVSRIRPDFIEPVKTLLRQLADHSELSAQDLQDQYPGSFEALSELLASAYFLDDRVAEILDYRDKPMIPLDPEATRIQEMEDLVAPVIARGNVWRTTNKNL